MDYVINQWIIFTLLLYVKTLNYFHIIALLIVLNICFSCLQYSLYKISLFLKSHNESKYNFGRNLWMCEKHFLSWNINLWFNHFNGRVNILFWSKFNFISLFLLIFFAYNYTCKIIFCSILIIKESLYCFKQKFTHLLIVGNIVLPGDVNRFSEPGMIY